MSYSTFEIRTAMIQLGQKRGAEYPLCVVRDVIEAFKVDADHPVKDAVIIHIEAIRAENHKFANQEEVAYLRRELELRGIKSYLAAILGIRSNRLSAYANGVVRMPKEFYKKLITLIPNAKKSIIEFNENKPHGYAKYQSGCRCDVCKKGRSDKHRAYKQKKRLLAKQAKQEQVAA